MAELDSIERNALSLRNKALNHDRRAIRLAYLLDSQQEGDISKPIIFDGYVRLHTFSEVEKPGWILDPLPTIPASSKLECSPQLVRNARILQLSACNLRCWYCFVDYKNLTPSSPNSKEVSVSDIISALQLYSNEPYVLDLSGGNPGLVPEWLVWTIEELLIQDLTNIYVWIDDNLTINFYNRFLTNDQIALISSFPRFGSVGCFKGFDGTSFSFNTGLPESSFCKQFSNFKSLFSYNWDIYGYVTFTTPSDKDLQKRIELFVNALQEIDTMLPLRVIPLEIKAC